MLLMGGNLLYRLSQVKAVRSGLILVIDEADKAPPT